MSTTTLDGDTDQRERQLSENIDEIDERPPYLSLSLQDQEEAEAPEIWLG